LQRGFERKASVISVADARLEKMFLFLENDKEVYSFSLTKNESAQML
jgi:hypothetical protein